MTPQDFVIDLGVVCRLAYGCRGGLPGYGAGSMFSLLAPARTPEAVIRRLNQESVRYLVSPEGKEKFFNFG